jgi:hypothetical protein
MGLLSGSITASHFRTNEPPPKDFRDKVVKNMATNGFQDIDPAKNPELSFGWVQAFEPTERITALEQVVLGNYLVGIVRRDTKTVAPAALKLEVRKALASARQERKSGRPLTKEQVQDIRVGVRNKLLKTATPSTALLEMAWNFTTGDVFFSSTATKPCQEFVDLFERTFGLFLEKVTAYSRAEAYSLKVSRPLDLDVIERTLFTGQN